jgi:hypothetical protein
MHDERKSVTRCHFGPRAFVEKTLPAKQENTRLIKKNKIG